MTGVFIRQEETKKHGAGEDDQVTIEAEIGETQLQAEGYHRLPAITRSRKTPGRFSSRAFSEGGPASTLTSDFQFIDEREYISV